MPTETVDTIIIGGGLSGIYAAYLLSQRNKSFVLLEARERMGGRILSREHHGLFCDLGPSWYWPEVNPKMAHLIQALGLKGYRQFEEGMGRYQIPDGAVHTVRGYPMQPSCWRFSGGMTALITKLCEHIPENATQFDQPPMYQHPLYHPPAGKTSIWDGTIHFAGTETADQHGGYLEGALTAAERAVMNH